jgi:CheY-like chemotaxis protein
MDATILIVDDERDMRIYLRTLLRKAGYTVIEAIDGIEGVELALERRPDLIVMDMVMPRQSGATAYETLRDTPETSGIPVVILTGVTTRAAMFDDESSSAPKPAAFLDKPIDREDFLRQIGAILGDRA